jgi:uncharacterized membrane protein
MELSSPVVPTILLAAASGARSMTGVAATARALGSPRVAGGAAALAAMELVADKLPFIPNRTDPGPLAGRVVAGGVIGAAIAGATGRNRVSGALAGAAAAFVSAHLSFHLRRELSAWLPATGAALVEDAIVGAVAAAGVSALTTQESLPRSA